MESLSIPTWIIHVSSVLEWMLGIVLVWRYGARPGREAWRTLAWGMLPSLGSAMCACTWHFFENIPELEWLVMWQAALTVVGNVTLMAAAWWIWRSSRADLPQGKP